MMNKKTVLCLCILIVTVFMPSIVRAHSYNQGDLEIVHPWARAMPDVARVGSGFMEIRNEGQTSDRLLGVRSDVAERIEIHSMEMDGDVMKMRVVEGGLEIPAGESLVLKPGGYHLMFFAPQTLFKQGEHFHGELVFEKAGSVGVTFHIEAPGSKAGHHDHAD